LKLQPLDGQAQIELQSTSIRFEKLDPFFMQNNSIGKLKQLLYCAEIKKITISDNGSVKSHNRCLFYPIALKTTTFIAYSGIMARAKTP